MKHFSTACTIGFLVFSGTLNAFGQQPSWSKRYGGLQQDNLAGLVALRGGGYLLSGSTPAGAGSTMLYLVRTDAQGDTLWTRKQRIRTYSSVAPSPILAEGPNGRVLLAGGVRSGTTQAAFLALLNTATGDTL